LISGESVSILPGIKYLIFKKLTGTATGDLIFYCINYNKTNN